MHKGKVVIPDYYCDRHTDSICTLLKLLGLKTEELEKVEHGQYSEVPITVESDECKSLLDDMNVCDYLCVVWDK